MKRWYGIGALAALVLGSQALAGPDAPHDQTFGDGNCYNCHALYTMSPGGVADYSQGCVSCHNTVVNSRRGFPWLSSDQASPGESGNQHSWSGMAVNPGRGARAPTASSVAQRLVDGKLQCSVCHDPHRAAPENTPRSLHTSIAVGTPVDESGGPAAGTARMTLVSPGTAAKGYRLKIQTANAGGGTFVVSHDFGLTTPSWFNWSGSAWVPGTVSGPGKPYVNGADVTLNDPAVSVRFTAGAVADNYWDFWVSYPFVRMPSGNDEFCLNCHFARDMDSRRVRGAHPTIRPDGVRRFSHPVGEAIGSNGKGYDRTVATVLDANGATQITGDGNPTNDLSFHAGGVVRCTTCHSVHNADSNSLTQ